MFTLSNALFIFAACQLVVSAPVPSVVLPGPSGNDAAIDALQDFKRQADDAGLIIPPGFKPLATSSKEFINLDTSNFKRRDISDDAFGPAEGSAFASEPLSDVFKRQADDAGLVLPPDFKPLVTSSKEFLRFDGSDFKRRADDISARQADDAGLIIPPGFKPLATSSKEFLRFDGSDFKRSPAKASEFLQEPESGGIFKRQELDIPPDFKPALDFGGSKELVNFDSTDF